MNTQPIDYKLTQESMTPPKRPIMQACIICGLYLKPAATPTSEPHIHFDGEAIQTWEIHTDCIEPLQQFEAHSDWTWLPCGPLRLAYEDDEREKRRSTPDG